MSHLFHVISHCFIKASRRKESFSKKRFNHTFIEKIIIRLKSGSSLHLLESIVFPSTHCVLSSSYRSLFILLPRVQELKLCGFLPHSSISLA